MSTVSSAFLFVNFEEKVKEYFFPGAEWLKPLFIQCKDYIYSDSPNIDLQNIKEEYFLCFQETMHQVSPT